MGASFARNPEAAGVKSPTAAPKQARVRVERRLPHDPAAYYLLLGAALFLAVFGLIMVFSAGTGIGLTRMQDAFFFARRQAMWLLIGMVLMGLCAAIDYRRLAGLPAAAWWVSMVLLVGVWVPGLGWTSNGATRWIRLGSFTVQPSEIAKLVVLVCVAQALSAHSGEELTLQDMGRPLLRWALAPFVLILLEPDMGTAMSLLIGPLVICFVLGMRWRDLGLMFAGLASMVVVAVKVAPYRMARIVSFADPFKDAQKNGWQMVQSLLSFGAGGLAGAGLGAGKQKFLYLPAAHTDFIFAVVGEELGLIGTIAVVAAFLALAYAGFRIALRARDPFGRALAGGIIGAVTFQAVLNMAAVTKLVPITGVPLPFISFGGWALMTTMAGIGLVLSVGTEPRRQEDSGEGRDQRGGNGRARVPGDRARLGAVKEARSA